MTDIYGFFLKQLSPAAEAWPCSYHWPGNIRGLSHQMGRVMLFYPEDMLELALLERWRASATKPGTRAQPEPIEDGNEGQQEAARIREALQRTGDNVMRASRLLELSRKALRYRLSRSRITPTASTNRRCRSLPLSCRLRTDARGTVKGACMKRCWRVR